MYNPPPSSDLMAALDAAAIELATAPPDAWAGWIVYLLEALEAEDAEAVTSGDYGGALKAVAVAITDRLACGGW